MEKLKISTRYKVPENSERAPYKTITKIVVGMGENEKHTYYIQISKDEDKPHWMKMGDFLEIALESMFNKKRFVDETLLLYSTKKA